MRFLKPQSLLLLSLLTVLAVAPLWAQTELPAGQVGILYKYLVPVQGGKPPLTWSVKGQLPDGLTINKHNGLVQGVPTKEGTYQFDVWINDSSKQRRSEHKTYSVLIKSAEAMLADTPFCSDPPEIDNYDIGRLVRENYLEIVYDAHSGKTQWQRHETRWWGLVQGASISAPQNALLTPYAYQKERILVKVCNSKFQSTLTATATATPIPEAGLDIHGLTQAALTTTPGGPGAPAKAAVGGAGTPPPTDPIDAMAQLPNAKDAITQYLAGLKDAYDLEYRELKGSIDSLYCEPASETCNLDTPGYLLKVAEKLDDAVKKQQGSRDAKTNQGKYTELAARTTALAASVSNLASALATASLPTRYSQLLSDGQTLKNEQGKLAQNVQSAKDTVQTDQNNLAIAQATVEDKQKSLDKAKIDLSKATSDNRQAAQNSVDKAQTALDGATKTRDQNQQTLTRDQAKAKDLESADSSLKPGIEAVLGAPVSDLVTRIQDIDSQMTTLHQKASEVFKEMNSLHDSSRFTIASVVTPVSSNAVLTVVITLQDQFSPFGFGPAQAAKGTTPGPTTGTGNVKNKNSGGDGGGKGPTAPGGQDQQQQQAQNTSQQQTQNAPQNGSPAGLAVVKQVLVEVHRLSDFNIVSGFAVSSIRARAFALHPYPSPMPGTAPTFQVAYQSQNTPFQYQYIVGLNMYLKKRDFFPGYLTKAMRFTPGILVGTSVTSSGNFKVGLDWEFWNGVDIYGGFDLGQITRLGNGVVLGSTPFPLTATSVPTNTNFQGGGFFGLGFDANVFQSIFKKVFSQ